MNQRSNCQHLLEHRKSSPEKLLLLFINYTKAFDCVDHSKLWKILKDGNTRPPCLPPEKLVCWSRSNSRTLHGTMDWFKVGKGVWQSCILTPYLCNLIAYFTLCEIAGLMNHRLELRLLGEISITSDTQMTPHLWQKVKKNLRAAWWKWKRRVKKLA